MKGLLLLVCALFMLASCQELNTSHSQDIPANRANELKVKLNSMTDIHEFTKESSQANNEQSTIKANKLTQEEMQEFQNSFHTLILQDIYVWQKGGDGKSLFGDLYTKASAQDTMEVVKEYSQISYQNWKNSKTNKDSMESNKQTVDALNYFVGKYPIISKELSEYAKDITAYSEEYEERKWSKLKKCYTWRYRQKIQYFKLS